MKKSVLILMMIFLTNGYLMSQVFLSSVFKDEIIFGAKSISIDSEIVAEMYQLEISDFKKRILKEADFCSEKIEQLESEETTKRKIKQFKQVEKQLELINKEIELIDELIKSWDNAKERQDQLLLLYENFKNGKCLSIETSEGVFFNDEIEVELIEENNLEYFEKIPIDHINHKKEWVKKKADENCLSADPNDCLVWCLVEKQESYTFKDIKGKEHELKECPSGFDFDEAKKECLFQRIINEERNAIPKIIIKRIEDDNFLTMKKWNLENC